MRELLHRLSGLLKLDRRDWTVFLLSLLLALSIWLLHNLALNYTDFVSVSVIARSGIDGRAEVSANSSEVVARCRCEGFNLLGMKMRGDKPRVIDFKAEDFHYLGGDSYFLTAKELQGYAHELFEDGSTVEFFLTDTVFFRFSAVSCKKVPVILNGEFIPAPQYMIVGGLRLEPDSVTVYGEPSALSSLDGVLTAKLSATGLDRDRNGVLKLNRIKGLRYSAESVSYSANVVRYVDITVNASVRIDNKPSDVDMVAVPPVVKARLSCAFPFASDPSASAVFYVDYNDYVKSLAGNCPVKLRNVGAEVLDYVVEPSYVELIKQ